MDGCGGAAIAGAAAVLHKSYLHQNGGETSCWAKTKPLVFHVLEKSCPSGEEETLQFVPMSESRGNVSGVFPICVSVRLHVVNVISQFRPKR